MINNNIKIATRIVQKIPVLGVLLMRIWRLYKDPYLGPIGDRISDLLPRWRSQTIVQIGVNDGLRFDPISSLINNRKNWRVLFVEPIPAFFEELKKNFGGSKRFLYECSAISDSEGDFSFYFISPEARREAIEWKEYYDLIGSLDRGHVVNALGTAADEFEKYIVQISRPCRTPETSMNSGVLG